MPEDGKKLHILTLTPFYPTDSDDSAGSFVYEPLVSLAKRGVRHSVFALQPVYRATVESGRLPVPAHWFRYFSLPGGTGLPTAGAFAFAKTVASVRRLHHEQPVDLIHAHGTLPCGHAAMLLSRELYIPFVVSVHGLDAFSDVQVRGLSGRWCRRISTSVYRASRRVICVSEKVREAVLEGVGRNCRTSVVYNGVDEGLFAPQASFPSSEGTIVLSVGNLISIKGHEVLIRAIASIAQQFPDLRVDVIGQGPERGRLQALSEELHISASVRFRGVQGRKQVAEAMRQCTLFALPSRYEALGCAYLEAMASAKPVIGCRGQGIAEIVRQGFNGFLVGSDNEKELALAISMLLGDESRRQNIGRAARETILDAFTLTQQAEKLERIYRECAT